MRSVYPLLLVIIGCADDKGLLGPLQFLAGPPVPSMDSGDTSTTGESGSPPDPDRTIVEGPDGDAGFGSAVAVDGDRIWVGAPHGSEGVVYSVVDDALEPLLNGGGRLGSAIAVTPTGLWIGAPLSDDGAGAVFDENGELVLAGTGSTGLALAGGATPAVAVGTGWTRPDGDGATTPSRPTSIAVAGDRVGIGMARGDIMLQVGDLTAARNATHDEAGFSLAAADLDGDGDAEWILGAPGADAVYVLNSTTLETVITLTEIGGGFGTAVAACDPDGDGRHSLLVGAPGADGTAGRVVHYSDPMSDTEADTWSGDVPGRFLGFALACGDAGLVLGAPGGGAVPGQVWIIP